MKKHTVYTIPFRRKREDKTNYKTRLRLLLSGQPRLVARLSSKNVIVQLIGDNAPGDKVLASASTKQLAKLGWKGNGGNTSAAYLAGLLLASKAKKAKITEAIFDIGIQTSKGGSRLYAVLKGAIDGGLSVPASEEIFPTNDRITGKHIQAHAKEMKSKEPEKYKKYFSLYLKKGLNPEEITQHFETIKKKIEAI
jgi:large subunit ribosomal protein L18